MKLPTINDVVRKVLDAARLNKRWGFLLIVLASHISKAQYTDLNFTNFRTKNGLSSNTVNAISRIASDICGLPQRMD